MPDPQTNAVLEENVRLRRAVEELSVLNDLARAISASLDSQEIMATIIRRSLRAVQAEQGVITLVDQQSGDTMKTLVRAMGSSTEHEKFHLNQTLLGWMHLNKVPLLMNSPKTDERFKGVSWDESVRSLLCVPMMMKSELKGVLTIYNKKDGKQFTDEDQRILAIIAAQSAQVIENSRLNEREKQLLKMQEEVRLASRIQQELLPQKAPVITGYDIAGKSIPAQVVGGDYFDFVTMDDSMLAICLGDVTGKGLPASLLMANTQATLRGQALLKAAANECIQRANKLLYQSTDPEKFVTLFYGILDITRHVLSYSNAGQDPPILITCNGNVRRLDKGGIALGMLDEFPFDEETVQLQPGDVLVLYSDGISEAMNPMQEQFTDARLERLLGENLNSPAAALIDTIVDAVKSHAGTAPQMDDMTLVVVKRTS
ncbi:MAG: SpoIIE family protein phosphatase [Ignavibacteriae bacterium]|nr:SpoIIE family protein phosphatase [Ignavibacteriota bacterium]